MKNGYSEYLELWLQGLESEIDFWLNYMANKGGIFFYGFNETTSSQRKFELENDIPNELIGTEISFIDVGSGPFSRCGHVTDKVKLNAISVDPLAEIYTVLKTKYGLDNGVNLKSGFVELLEYEFESNSFDIVHMSNSLDHCFSAIDGIRQLLNICKIGGKVILRHSENEAENEKYVGLHQWNLSLHNDENTFLVWRKNVKIDVCKMFGEYADFYLYPDENEAGKWIYNKVVMIKKKNIAMPENEYYEQMLGSVYSFLLKKLYIGTKGVHVRETDIRLRAIQECYDEIEKFKSKMKKRKIDNVLIYGMGNIGKNFEYLLNESKLTVKAVVDKRGAECGSKNVIKLEQCTNISADAAIITIEDKDGIIADSIIKTIGNIPIYNIMEILK